MKKHFFILVVVIISITSCNTKKEILPVSEPLNWDYSDSLNANVWEPAKVPGDIQQSLSANYFLWNNFYLDKYIDKINWLSHKTWFYKSKFNIDKKTYEKKEIWLNIRGLDTYSKIYINGKVLTQTNDFFKSYKFDIKSFIKPGNNQIIIQFFPPLEYTKKFYNSLNYNDKKLSPLSILRKPYFHFNRDISNNYIPIGFPKDINLTLWEKAFIEDSQFFFSDIDSDKAICTALLKVYSTKAQKAKISIESQYAIYINQKVNLKPGHNKLIFTFKIPKPKLWYPISKNNIKPEIYKFTSSLYIGQILYDENIRYSGIRKVDISTENNKLNLKINDSTIKLKAAEILPLHINLANETEKYEHFISLIKEAGFNAVITSDKGWYYNDKFYTLCDLNGIMVIQTLPIAYKAFPPKDTIVNTIISETIQNINALRNHPSIIAWNANFSLKRINAYNKEIKDFSNKFFTQLLPIVIKNIDTNRTFLINTNFKNLVHYNSKLIALPNRKTTFQFLQYLDPRANKDSVLAYYAKPSGKNYFKSITKIKNSFPADSVNQLIYFSQLYQYQQTTKDLDAVSMLNYDHIIIGWFNDITPAISPAYIDSRLKPRANYYALKTFLKPFRIIAKNNINNVDVTIISDYDTANILAYFKLYDFYGRLLWQKITKQKMLSHYLTQSFDLGIYFKLFSRDTILMKIEIYNNLELVAEKYHYFKNENSIRLHKPILDINYYPIDNGYAIELAPTNFLSKNTVVEIEGLATIENNFFDILPGESKIIIVKTPIQTENFGSLITIYSKYDYLQSDLLEDKIIHKKEFENINQ